MYVTNARHAVIFISSIELFSHMSPEPEEYTAHRPSRIVDDSVLIIRKTNAVSGRDLGEHELLVC